MDDYGYDEVVDYHDDEDDYQAYFDHDHSAADDVGCDHEDADEA